MNRVSHLHEGLVGGTGELLMLDLHSARCNIGCAVSTEIKSVREAIFVVNISCNVVLQLCTRRILHSETKLQLGKDNLLNLQNSSESHLMMKEHQERRVRCWKTDCSCKTKLNSKYFNCIKCKKKKKHLSTEVIQILRTERLYANSTKIGHK